MKAAMEMFKYTETESIQRKGNAEHKWKCVCTEHILLLVMKLHYCSWLKPILGWLNLVPAFRPYSY